MEKIDEKDTLSQYAKESTLQWLNSMQSDGCFDGFEEENKDFSKCDEEDLAWYFIEWFFTEMYAEDSDDEELLEERKRILSIED